MGDHADRINEDYGPQDDDYSTLDDMIEFEARRRQAIVAEKMSLEDVAHKVGSEGFDYAFMYYSDFKEVDDPEFHRLREAYVKAATELRDYLPDVEDEDF